MAKVGYFLSSEEFGPELVRQTRLGKSPFVWSVIGAVSPATSLPVTR